MNIDFEPSPERIIARLLVLNRTLSSGLVLPETDKKGETVLVEVESVGTDVRSCKPGDIVAPLQVGHIWMLGGTIHRVKVEDKDVVAVVKGLSKEDYRYFNKEDRDRLIAEANGEAQRLVGPSPGAVVVGPGGVPMIARR